ncbi:Transcriptional regulator of nonfermentable carbon utilization [Malassezia sp. CBS 17886]|nr:Transcriptional regulator of nonfermentable carbon utilization [Malassezia sp. CBS 17886]
MGAETRSDADADRTNDAQGTAAMPLAKSGQPRMLLLSEGTLDRCIRKGVAEQCVDGYRKKAKYLLDEDEMPATTSHSLPPDMPTPVSSPFVGGIPGSIALSGGVHTFSPTALHDPAHGTYGRVDPAAGVTGAPFGFDPTSLEVSILSSMLNDTEPGMLSGDSPEVPVAPSMELMDNYTHLSNVSTTTGDMASWNTQRPSVRPLLEHTAAPPDFTPLPPLYPQDAELSKQESNVRSGNAPDAIGAPVFSQAPAPMLTSDAPKGVSPRGVSGAPHHARTPTPGARALLPAPDCDGALATRHSGPEHGDDNADALWQHRVARVYRDVTRPFRYTEGYHFLLKYATQKYDKADVLRIVRALAIFRPSLIALQVPLCEEDEVFVERAFQRTILEFEKLISFSGTPTVVWRRTGEIALVGAEFCMLTQWSKEDLMGKFMYQFMDKDSVVRYWEQFANHAFENTTPTVMTTCVLLTPSGKPIPCTWSFTIKRDPFDLPGYVVGNFLPILS